MVTRNAVARLRRFCREEDGPSATEYAILLALIVLVSVAAIQSVSTGVYRIYDNINLAIPD